MAVGALGLLHDRPAPLAPADLGVARAFADLTAIVIAWERAHWSYHAPGVGAAAVGTHEAVADAIAIEQAKGVLAERDRLTMDQAHTRLRRIADARQRQVREVARAVVTGVLGVFDPVPTRPVGDQGDR